MPSLKEIKNRINSVQSTRKITSAMKMVASSKLHQAQMLIENMLPYEGMLETILKSFLAEDTEAKGSITAVREIKKAALIVFSSNSSLCGGFNTNVIKLMQKTIAQYEKKGIEITIYPIGRKVAEKVAKLGYKSVGNFQALADKPNSHDCVTIGRELGTMYKEGKIDHVDMIYHHFKSAGSQILQKKTLIPINIEKAMDYDHTRDLENIMIDKKTQEYLKEKGGYQALEGEKSQSKILNLKEDFIVEPDRETVLQALIPKYVNLMIYTALLDSNASEHAARMVAMQTATDNADALLNELTLTFNKTRQAAITTELLDIVGGSMK